jgi:hypothetical protein
MLFNAIVLVMIFAAFALEEFIPAVAMAHNARLFLAPVFFFCASVAVPFPMMLCLAFTTGLLWDARYLPMVSIDSGVEQVASASLGGVTSNGNDLGFGVSILLFGVLGMLMQGIRPLFRKGRWEMPVLMVGFVMMVWLLTQYLLMTFLRGEVFFPRQLWVKLVSDALMAMLASPLFYLCLHTLAGATNYEIKYEGLRYRFDGR